jgi:hypothetical protein
MVVLASVRDPDPDSMGCLNPDSESGSRGKKKKKMRKNLNLYYILGTVVKKILNSTFLL